MGHKHVYTALWSHWGPYANQDEHFHPCDCGESVMVGVGRSCATGQEHVRKHWNERLVRWVKSR